MNPAEFLKGKRILIVDDEPDVLETLVELLDMCRIDAAPDFQTAKKFLEKNRYDAAILDIMGVSGYELLEITRNRGVPALMLTAHALSAESLTRTLKIGAAAYIPKENMHEIGLYLAEMIREPRKEKRMRGWFARLKPFFDSKFGVDWQKDDPEFWKEFEAKYIPTKEELERML